MIVVAIMGVIASIGMMAYSQYIDTSRAGAVNHNYQLAVRLARDNYVTAVGREAMRAQVGDIIPPDSASWVDMLNSGTGRAPSGVPPYEVGVGSNVAGTVGVVFTGSYAGSDSAVTISRPAYADLPASSTTISQINF